MKDTAWLVGTSGEMRALGAKRLSRFEASTLSGDRASITLADFADHHNDFAAFDHYWNTLYSAFAPVGCLVGKSCSSCGSHS